jgi:glycosyltransferase involved in cell wall biosynthesis
MDIKKEDIKVMFIHCYYHKWGGEDVTFEAEKNLFPNRVEYTVRNKPGIAGFFQFLHSIWNVDEARKISRIVEKENPDIVHVYNFHFGIGYLFIRYLKKRFNVPVIATVQNYRALCPSATLLINGKLNDISLKQSFPWTAIFKRAYKNSMLLTSYLAFINWFHKKINTWNKFNLILVQTEFARQIFLASKLNFSQDQVMVKANGIEHKFFPERKRGNRFLFVGRISHEKGIHILLEVFSQLPYFVDVVGEGPLLNDLKYKYSHCENISFLGQKNSEQVKSLMCSATALLFPSIWYEGMPLTILEAFACGTPVLASAIGAMNYLIEPGVNGWLVQMGNANDWKEKIQNWNGLDENEKIVYSKNAMKIFLQKYSSGVNESSLLNIYTKLLSNNNKVNIIKKAVEIV